MPVIRHADARRTETPNAVMTTLASPTQGGAAHAVWRVDMRPGQLGPQHVFDAEQIYTVIEGSADVEIDGSTHRLVAGDTVVIPATVRRQITADSHVGLMAVVASTPEARATLPDGTDRGTPEWVR